MRQPTILVVEDDDVLRDTIAYNLRREDFLVLTAADGVLALDTAQHNHISLIMLDLMLPRLSGLDVCKRLRAQPETAQIPILVLTARDGETEKILALEVGADDYVTKPFSWMELRSRIRALLRRSSLRGELTAPVMNPAQQGEETADRVLMIDGIKLDVDKRLVIRNGAPITMKPRIFDLLVYMARYRGVVLTRDRLLEHVWGYEYSGDNRTVDVHVRWLREKIEDDPNNPQIIQTVRGVGYRVRDKV